ncbi:leucyl aminopeptidase [Helicobacter cholecystus]|uniref:Probable cytosol aminopeptidase n=1 Tax=Helicobacter cholecystus TaxID=45498 RepID=A0A3D8IYP1_9HELI|nr:leucyl aminopeptidase [Helicobacter cholecystus]RDU70173.1 leucyl aminopeptidase [Helicobacter cholecystus]VEJ24647.1 aminopeptidase [Helicobacter cholecystus]
MKIEIFKESFENIQADCSVVWVWDKDISKLADKETLQELNFKEMCFIQGSKTLYINLAKQQSDLLREAACRAIKFFTNFTYKSIKIQTLGNEQEDYAILLGALSGAYCFDAYKSEKKPLTLQTLHLSNISKELLRKAEVLNESLTLVRDLVNTPPCKATPSFLAQCCRDEAQKLGIECKILSKGEIEKEGMNSLLAVSKASSQEPKVIHLSYKGEDTKAKLVFVGKGLTYDSGGLSLKPSDFMVTMKADKSGGCAVLGIILAIAKLKLPLEVHAIIGAVENMIGGNAYKPDDVLSSREGKSIEVRNTDAEGRLVLIDCLSYAQDLKPDYLIDLATLTGACVVGLGEYTFGIMGHNAELKNSFEREALKSGELVAQLPFNSHIKKLIDSKIADVCNIASSRYGGAISAGMFLGEFIRKENEQKWLHLDIAGPAYIEKEWDINPYGASGAGVRACVEFALSLCEEK